MDDVKVGQTVRILESHARGVVREVDNEFFAARIELNHGGEKWTPLDELEIVAPWESRKRMAYEGQSQ
ncbi:MAG: hypothetical protein ACXU9Z_07615 [Gemmatimonadaceae bacterium]